MRVILPISFQRGNTFNPGQRQSAVAHLTKQITYGIIGFNLQPFKGHAVLTRIKSRGFTFKRSPSTTKGRHAAFGRVELRHNCR